MRLGSCPGLLALALSVPQMSLALGLGSLHVDSRLNEPLSAQIDIVGATPEELKNLRAAVADPEAFQRYRLERPAFLASAKLAIAFDAQGGPVITIRSTDAFTEPLVDFLVDLRWGKEELLRNYTLLLDPAPLTTAAPAPPTAATRAQGPPTVRPEPEELSEIVPTLGAIDSASPVVSAPATKSRTAAISGEHRIGRHDTLRSIARRAGARSEADQQRMILAIFEANPQAFAGNINRLHRGAILKIPSLAQVRATDRAAADREISAQMSAWREGRPGAQSPVALPATAKATPVAPLRPAAQGTDISTVLSAMNQLDGQVQFLRQTLGETNKQLASATARINHVEQGARQGAAAAMPSSVTAARPASSKPLWGAIGWALALLVAGLAYVAGRFLPARSRPNEVVHSEEATVEAPIADPAAVREVLSAMAETEAMWTGRPTTASQPAATVAPAAPPLDDDGTTVEIAQPVEIDIDALERQEVATADEPDTVIMDALEPAAADGTATKLDYNLSDLDGRAQHVEMPGSLSEHVVVVERRKNIVDILMGAIRQDPSRSDLRMKLLETLYSAAAKNLRAFKEVARDLMRHPERLSAGEWEQVSTMGREIAPGDAMFAAPAADEDIADCA